MSTLLLQAAVGAASATPLGAGAQAVLAIAGTIIDTELLLPALFPGPDVVGQKLDDLHVQSGAEGSGVNRCWGEASRGAGTVIWLSNLIEVTNLSGNSGNGAGLQAATMGKGGDPPDTLSYYCHAAIGVCEGEIEGIDMIWADGKVFLAEQPPQSVIGTDISAAFTTTLPTLRYQLLQPPQGLEDPSLADLQAGIHATISGYPRKGTANLTALTVNTTALINSSVISLTASGLTGNVQKGDRLIIGSDVYFFTATATASGGTITNAPIAPNLLATATAGTPVTIDSAFNGVYLVESANNVATGTRARFAHPQLGLLQGLTQAAGPTVTVDQTPPIFAPNKADDVRIYNGTKGQMPDSLIESYKGAGNVPGYRGLAYVVIEMLELRDYGNRLPNFTFLVRRKTNQSTGEVVRELCHSSGLPAARFDTSALTEEVVGYALKGAAAIAQGLQPVLLAHDLLVQDVGSQLIFRTRANPPMITIDADKLGVREIGGDAPRPVRMDDVDPWSLPREVRVHFQDVGRDYETGTKPDRSPRPAAGEPVDLNLPLAMTPATARRIARKARVSTALNRRGVELYLPPSELLVRESSLVTFLAHGQTFTALLTRVEHGVNGQIIARGVLDDLEILNQSVDDLTVGEEAATSSGGIAAPPVLEALIYDFAPLHDDHIDQPGYYVATAPMQPGARWTGGTLFESNVASDAYAPALIFDAPATMGETIDALGVVSGQGWDLASSVTVVLVRGQLYSTSEDAVLGGANRAMVGSELVGFTTATLTAERTYELSGFIRGLRDTDPSATHIAGEAFVLLDRSTLQFVPINQAAIGTTRTLKAVASGQAASLIQGREVTFQGATLRPFRPGHFRAQRRGNGDVDFSWVRRSRRISRLFSEYEVMLDEPEELYQLVIRNAALATLRTVSVSSPVFVYTAAMQLADGIVVGAELNPVVYQSSFRIGRGNAALLNVP